MTAAIFGFIGVLVRGLVTWGIEVWRARHGEQDEARVAARLVADELDTIYLERLKVHSVEPQFPRQIDYRATLARELDDESWNKVGGAYDVLATEFEKLASTAYSPAEVDESYNAGLAALKPLMTSKRRYWWQRVFRHRSAELPLDESAPAAARVTALGPGGEPNTTGASGAATTRPGTHATPCSRRRLDALSVMAGRFGPPGCRRDRSGP